MIENAITFDNTDNSTELVLYLSDTVQVLKEEMAFPFGSLVADCGGILGLFIGFNFLMIWDWIMKCLKIWSDRIKCCVSMFKFMFYVYLLCIIYLNIHFTVHCTYVCMHASHLTINRNSISRKVYHILIFYIFSYLFPIFLFLVLKSLFK